MYFEPGRIVGFYLRTVQLNKCGAGACVLSMLLFVPWRPEGPVRPTRTHSKFLIPSSSSSSRFGTKIVYSSTGAVSYLGGRKLKGQTSGDDSRRLGDRPRGRRTGNQRVRVRLPDGRYLDTRSPHG